MLAVKNDQIKKQISVHGRNYSKAALARYDGYIDLSVKLCN